MGEGDAVLPSYTSLFSGMAATSQFNSTAEGMSCWRVGYQKPMASAFCALLALLPVLELRK